MRAVVDTNVIAYHLLGTPKFASEAGDFLARAQDLVAPSLWQAEIANVIWMAVRSRVLAPDHALAKLTLAMRLGVEAIPIRTLWHAALIRSLDSDVAVYDTLFIELAERESLPLVTFDQRLLAAFPKVAKRPRACP